MNSLVSWNVKGCSKINEKVQGMLKGMPDVWEEYSRLARIKNLVEFSYGLGKFERLGKRLI